MGIPANLEQIEAHKARLAEILGECERQMGDVDRLMALAESKLQEFEICDTLSEPLVIRVSAGAMAAITRYKCLRESVASAIAEANALGRYPGFEPWEKS